MKKLLTHSERIFQDAKKLIEDLESSGFQARLAGGCVRDRLMGLEPKDYDIATNALPEEICTIFKQKGYRVVPTGLEHGTITVVTKASSYEITTLRLDVDTDGRHATVQFGCSFQDDAARRDFTINALTEDKSGKVYDYFGGIEDLKEGRLRFVGNPTQRIKEDYLRSLRFFRFWARFNFTPDEESLEAIRNLKEGLTRVSQERITSETLLLLEAKEPALALREIAESKIADEIFPFLDFNPKAIDLINRSQIQDSKLNSICRLSLLIPDTITEKKEIEKIQKSLKLSNQQGRQLFIICCGLLKVPQPTSEIPSSTFMNFLDYFEDYGGRDCFTIYLLSIWKIKYQERKDTIKAIEDVANKYDWLRKSALPITGRDLIKELQLKQCPKIGDLLLVLKNSYRDQKWSTKEEGIELARKIYKEIME